ncbi:hypothetical protein [Vibrio harveyi]|uniref:hypothetical protein n=1 Tax=Vibrio harveyi TaxID=669 RepID=UPI004068C057
MKLKKISVALIAALGATLVYADSAVVYKLGERVASIEKGNNVRYISADDVVVPKGLQVTIFSEEAYTGEKQTLKQGETPSFSFKSLEVKNDINNKGLFIAVKPGLCIDLAIELDENYSFTNLYADGEGHRGKMMGMDAPLRKYKKLCSTDGAINVMDLVENKVGDSALGKQVLLSAYGINSEGQGYGYNFFLRATLPDKNSALGKFTPEDFGYMGNYFDYRRVMNIDNKEGKVTIGL